MNVGHDVYGDVNTAGATIDGLNGNGGVVSDSLASTFTVGFAGGTGSFSGILANGTGTLSLTKVGAGTQTLTGANTYTGVTTVNGGVLSVSTMAAGGVASGIGAATNAAANLVLGGGTLQYTGASVTTDHNFTLTLGTVSGINVSTAGTNLLVTGQSAATTGGLTKTGAGTLSFTGANTYTGVTTINAGTLNAFTIGNGGVAGGVGAATNAAANLVLGGGTLQYSGANASTDRGFTLTGGTTSGFDVIGGVSLTMTGAAAATTGGFTKLDTGTLILTGSEANTARPPAAGGVLQIGNGGVTGALGSGAIVDNATLTYDLGNTATVANAISGTGTLVQAGTGTTILTGANTYGATTISAGTLQIGNGGSSGSLGAGPVTDNAALVFNLSGIAVVPNAISGTGTLTQNGPGTTALTGTNSYSGVTTISAGILQIGNGGVTGTLGTAGVTDNATLAFNRSDAPVVGNVVSGTGGILQSGTGTTILTATETNTGVTTISAGTLQIGNAGTTGALGSGAVTDNATLTFNRSNASTVANTISGSGAVVQNGAGTLTLTGTNTYTGATRVNAGTLTLTGTLGDTAMTVASAPRSPHRTTNGSVTIANGGNLTGAQGSLLTTGALTLASGANLNVGLSSPGTSALFQVNGNMTLAGNLNITSTGAFGAGVYRLINYTGGITDNGIVIGTVPAGTAANNYFIQTAVGNQVNLIDNVGASLNFWDGPGVATHNDGVIEGGLRTWNAVNDNWTTASGATNGAQGPGFLVFEGTPGVVTVDNTAGQVSCTGMQFAVTGYSVTGGAISINDTGSGVTLRVGDGTAAGSAYVATIASVIQNGTGAGNVIKTDLGTLILTGANTYAGTTTISGGTLQIGNAGTSGTLGAGAVTDNAALIFRRSDAYTVANAISGTGTLTQSGVGATILTAANTYSGTTTVSGGTLQIGNGGASGTLGTGAVTDNAMLTFDLSGTATVANLISGAGGLTQAGTGTTILTAANTYGGITTVSAGTLQVGAGGTSGSLGAGAVTVSRTGVLAFNRSDSITVSNAVSGTGSLVKNDASTLTLSGTSSYTGATSVNAGTLNLTGTLGNTAMTVASGATFTGTGATSGGVTIANGGTLAGTQGSTLTMGALTLSASSNLDVSLANPGTTRLFAVNGALTLGGNLNITSAGAFGYGVYRLIDYTGALTNNGLAIGAVPAGTTANNYSVQTAVANQVNLVNLVGANRNFWDGPGATNHNDGVIQGGSGTWNATNDNWTTSDGRVNAAQSAGFLVFQGVGGAVTIDDTAGQVSATGTQFAVNGYTVSGGALALANDATLGYATLRVGDGTAAGAGYTATIASVLQDATVGMPTNVNKTDLGTLILSGNNTYTGTTTITAGMLQIGAAGTSGAFGSGAVAVASGATLAFDRTDAPVVSNVISGAGAVRQIGAGTTILTGANTYSGVTTISAGVLQIGNAGTSGSLGTSGVTDNAALAFNRTDAVTVANVVSGTGTLAQNGAGTLTLSGASTYTGATAVNAGTLNLTGTLANTAMTVASGATLTGTGTTLGSVTVANGGTLAGTQGSTLTMGSLTLNASSNLNVSLANPGTTRLFAVNGNLTLAGNVNIASAGAFGAGVYRLIDYTGALTNNGAVIGAVPAGTAANYTLQTAVSGQVNLVDSVGSTFNFWDGPGATNHNDGVIQGGTGTWNAVNDNWTTANGATNGAQAPGFLIFQGAPGTVTIDNTAGQVSATGLQFAVNGYTIAGGALSLANAVGTATLRVGDGTAAGAGYTATIASVIQDAVVGTPTNINKTDLGTLILSGDNAYTGTTTITAGVLQIGNAGTSGSLGAGSVTDNGTLSFDRTDVATVSDAISGAGAVSQVGTGTTVFTGANSYTGTTTISGGTLRIGNGGASGALGAGAVTDNGTLAFNRTDTATVANAISGTGTLTQAGTGTTILTGANAYSGVTTISSGALQIGSAGTSGALGTGNVTDNASLVFNRSNAVTVANVIAGTGTLAQNGSGTLTLSGTSSYTGATSVNAGTLNLTGTLGNTAMTVASGGTLTGTGATSGGVTIANGGTLAGTQGSTLTLGGLVLNATSQVMNVSLANPGTDRALLGQRRPDARRHAEHHLHRRLRPGRVSPDRLHGHPDGQRRLRRLHPAGTTASDYSVQTSVANQVNLVNLVGAALNFWDGAGTTTHNDGIIQGGAGTWNATNDNWTTADGSVNGAQSPGFLVFQSAGGTVGIDDTTGQVSATGLQFAVDGYLIGGGALSLANDPTLGYATLRVGDGTAAGAGYTATIASIVQDAVVGTPTNINKTDLGTLILSGDNTYTGTTTVSGGVLQIGAGGTSGTLGAGAVIDNASLVFNRADTATVANAISGSGLAHAGRLRHDCPYRIEHLLGRHHHHVGSAAGGRWRHGGGRRARHGRGDGQRRTRPSTARTRSRSPTSFPARARSRRTARARSRSPARTPTPARRR